MKLISRLLILLTVVIVPVAGTTTETASNANDKVLYISQIPYRIRKHARPMRATRFYGKTVIQGQSVALHFYDVQPTEKLSDSLGRQKSQLNVFFVKQRRGVPLYERASTVPVVYDQWLRGKPTIQMDVTWLDPMYKTKPIIKVTETKRSLLDGMSGNHILFIFPNGIGAKAVVQTFGFDYNIGPTSASSNKFNKVDENGFITILSDWVDSRGNEYTAYKWDGSKFSKFQIVLDVREEPSWYLWNGKSFEKKTPEPIER